MILLLSCIGLALASNIRANQCDCTCSDGTKKGLSDNSGCKNCQSSCMSECQLVGQNVTVSSFACVVSAAAGVSCLRNSPNALKSALACAQKTVAMCDESALALKLVNATELPKDQCACLQAIASCVVAEKLCPAINVGDCVTCIASSDHAACLALCGTAAPSALEGVCGVNSALQLAAAAAVSVLALLAAIL
jgi:hypothetical protein